jgi:hypothetical protein
MKVVGTIWGKEEDKQEVYRIVFVIKEHYIDVWKGRTVPGTNGHCLSSEIPWRLRWVGLDPGQSRWKKKKNMHKKWEARDLKKNRLEVWLK